MSRKNLALICVAALLLAVVACKQSPTATPVPEPTATIVMHTATDTPVVSAEALATSTPGDVNVAFGLIKLPEGGVAATVNGVEITTAEYDAELRRQLVPLTAQYALDWSNADVQAYLPDIQDSILQQMIDFELLWQLARAEGIEITEAEIEAEYESTKQEILSEGYYTSWEQILELNNLTEEEAREQIADSLLVRGMVALHGGETTALQANASHILVADEETAKEVLAKLEAGEAFEELAKAYSTDTGTSENGGDLGWFPQGVMVTEFEEAVFNTLEVGQVSELVQTAYGYHIIKLVGREVRELEGDFLAERQETAFTDWYNAERDAADIQEFLSAALASES